MDNYYCNGLWFETYRLARIYADDILEMDNKYCVVYTRAEMDSQVKGMVNSIINHAEECGK